MAWRGVEPVRGDVAELGDGPDDNAWSVPTSVQPRQHSIKKCSGPSYSYSHSSVCPGCREAQRTVISELRNHAYISSSWGLLTLPYTVDYFQQKCFDTCWLGGIIQPLTGGRSHFMETGFDCISASRNCLSGARISAAFDSPSTSQLLL